MNEPVPFDLDLPSEENLQMVKPEYYEDNIYWVFVDPTRNNLVLGLFGFLFPIQEIKPPHPALQAHCLGKITEDAYQVLKMSTAETSIISFLDVENEEIHFYRLFFEILDDTYVNENSGHFISLDNIIRLRVKLVDDSERVSDLTSSISIKNMKSRDTEKKKSEMTITCGEKSDKFEIEVDNDSIIEIALESEGLHNIRFKCDVNLFEGCTIKTFLVGEKLSQAKIDEYKARLDN